MKVLVICGSIRAKKKNADIIQKLAACADEKQLASEGLALVNEGGSLSNSEIISVAAMIGASQRGAEVEYLPLVGLFEHSETPLFDMEDLADHDPLQHLDTLSIPEHLLDMLKQKVSAADGIVLATPVYFGDRSSVANKLLQVSAMWNLLQGKVFGMASVGAKRNGGQETCNIYSIMDALNQGALAVGNGPPTSQYGGTAVGGGKNHVFEDLWGLRSAVGVGTKVAHVADMVVQGAKAAADEPVHISIIVTNDTNERFLADYLQRLTDCLREDDPAITFEIHQVIDSTIYRCLACNTCPRPRKDPMAPPRCAIKDPEDYLEKLRESLKNSDAAIVAGLNSTDPRNLIFRYQVLTERMRYIRRNHFELTDLLMAGLCFNQFGATVNSLHTTKVLTSYIRQNSTFAKPIEILEHNGHFLEDGKASLLAFAQTARCLKHGKKLVPRPATQYETGGIAGGYKE